MQTGMLHLVAFREHSQTAQNADKKSPEEQIRKKEGEELDNLGLYSGRQKHGTFIISGKRGRSSTRLWLYGDTDAYA